MLTNYRFQALPLSPALCDDHLESAFQSQASSLEHLAFIYSLLAVTSGSCFLLLHLQNGNDRSMPLGVSTGLNKLNYVKCQDTHML